MSRIKNLYKYLTGNRRSEVEGWREAYEAFMADVAHIRDALLAGVDIRDKAAYEGTGYEGEENPWHAFAWSLIYEKSNGVSSRGQSSMREDNFWKFLQDQDFVGALAELIKQPSKDHFVEYSEAWEKTRQKLNAKGNPLLINRTLAACTSDVSSTVHGASFASVYWWLVNEGLIGALPNYDWYDANVQVMSWLHKEFATEIDSGDVSNILLSIFIWNLCENISNPFSLKKQIIKYGAPGTGKTYSAQQNARLMFQIWESKYCKLFSGVTYERCSEVVQFHPSYGYEDFIEGLRPTVTEKGESRLKLQNGVFKSFCRSAGKWEIAVYGIHNDGPGLAKRWPELTVGELMPHIGRELSDATWAAMQEIEADVKVAEVVPPFFFIVDEINRAELSRVLGELMFCLEYRGVTGAISTQYASLNDDKTGMLKIEDRYEFFIPHNLYFVGTMNTIDRSVESFDLALRRRFRWERMTPDIAALFYHLKTADNGAKKKWSALADSLAALNQRIGNTDILGEDYEIGHAYLMNLKYPTTLTISEVRESVWEDSIRPLLEEYLRGSGRADILIPEFAEAFGV